MSGRRFAETLRAWQEKNAARLVPGQVVTRTASGIDVAALYTPADLPIGSVNISDASEAYDSPDALGDWYRSRLGFPGEAPFTRGPQPGMYRERPWVMGMYSGRASPAETNRRIRSLLERGTEGFLGRPRPADPGRARLGPSARPRRGGPRRGADRHAARHARSARGNSARPGAADPDDRQRDRPDRRSRSSSPPPSRTATRRGTSR